MSTEIDITAFFSTEDATGYSASMAELGPDAGVITWRASIGAVEQYRMLDTPDRLDAFRVWLKPCGGWSEAEIAAMPDDHLNALFLQWVAADMRECGLNDPVPDWSAYEKRATAGQCPSDIYRDGKKVYFSLNL